MGGIGEAKGGIGEAASGAKVPLGPEGPLGGPILILRHDLSLPLSSFFPP